MKTPVKSRVDRTTVWLAGASLSCLAVLAGCGPQDGSTTTAATPVVAQADAKDARPVPAAPRVAPAPKNLGEVSSIETLTEKGKGTGVGAVAGGVIGGVLGHQVGSGRGNDVATAAGAVGGAVLGHKIEERRGTKVVGYRIHVRMDNGETRSFQRSQLDGLQVGSRVRVQDGTVRAA